MDSVLVFIYNVILIIIYTSVISMSCCLNSLRRRNINIAMIGLFSFYLLDTLVIFMTEHLSAFADWYNSMFLSSPSIKTVVYLGVAFFTLYCWNAFTDAPFSALQGIILICLGLFLVLVPMMQRRALKSWLYYTAYQVFSITLAAFALRKLKYSEDPSVYLLPIKTLRIILVSTILLSLCIIAEDSFVIFRLDNYIADQPHIFNRSISEDILHVIYCGIFFLLIKKGAYKRWIEPASDVAVSSDGVEELNESTIDSDAALLYKQKEFGHKFLLTEREMDIFRRILNGESNKQISESLYISPGTVKAHIHNIFVKADVSHRYELLRKFHNFVSNDFPSD